uniref:Tenascin XB n=1 Tax=Pseudonaja textilis TaxID=8673 RepID=A0A670ZLB3_PSETE
GCSARLALSCMLMLLLDTPNEGASPPPQEALGPPGSSRGGAQYEHTLEGSDQEHVVFTHRINLPQQSCGCPPGTKDTQELWRRLQALENDVRILQETCHAGGGCCPAASTSSQASEGQTDIHTLCSHHGSFDLSRCLCECESGWGGPTCADCEEPPSCPDDCNDQGRCVDGRCTCFPGYMGPSCSDPVCPQNCHGHGQCVSGWCVCNPGYSGADCATRACPSNCNRRGECRNGHCVCEPGFTGPACGTKTCPNDCNQRGHCLQGGVCSCHPDYTGPDCGQLACPEHCSGHGECQNGTCVCNSGYSGDDCSVGRCKGLNNQSIRLELEETLVLPEVKHNRGVAVNETEFDTPAQEYQYVVWYHTVSFFLSNLQKDPRAGESIHLPGTQRTFEYKGLKPGEEYKVTVRVEKGQHYGPPVTQTVRTRVAPPTGLQSSQASGNSLTLQWETPTSRPDGYILSYVPLVPTRPAPAMKRIELPAAPERVTLEDLQSRTRYRITLVARQSGENSTKPHLGRRPTNTTLLTKEHFLKRMTQNISSKLSPYNGTLLERLESYLRATNFPLRGNQTIQSIARDIYLYLKRMNSSDHIEVSLDSVRGISDHVVIRYRNTVTGERKELVVPGDASTATITGLSPGTTYLMEIHGVMKGHSSKSYSFITATGTRVGRAIQTIATPTSTPEAPLKNLQVTEISPNHLRVTWSAPPGFFQKFYVYYRDPKSGAPPKKISIPGTERSVDLMDLQLGTEYEVELHGERPGGSYIQKPKKEKPDETIGIKPSLGEFSVLDVTSDTIRLYWTVPTGSFDSFLIQYKDADGQPQALPVEGGSNEVTVTNLVPSRRYKFNLYGVSGRKRSSPLSTDATTGQLQGFSYPIQPGDFSVLDATSDLVHLCWTIHTGSFDSFVVQYKDANGQLQEISKEVIVQPLWRFNLYGVSGQKLSTSTLASTYPTNKPPSGPGSFQSSLGELSVLDATSDSVRLHWTVSTGSFDSFLIQYKDADGQPQALPVEGDSREVTVTNLVPSRRYKFNLYGVSGRKRSSPISTFAATGQFQEILFPFTETETEPIPVQPSLGEFSVLDVTSDTVRLFWTVSTGSFDSFLIQYKDADGQPQALQVEESSREVTVTNLAPSRRYKFNLYGVFGRKRSSPLSTNAITGQLEDSAWLSTFQILFFQI